tara:strand:- start:190 stop:1152 length:963 start_codon:yes stop_codon:yes gene_type:complete
MSEYGLKEAIDEHMPFIDEHLQKLNVPIFDRLMRAAHLFVDLAITDSSYESKEELLKSTAFIEGIIPLFNDWYWGKYGELAKNPTNRIYLGIITPYGHPVLVKIPATTSRVEMPNETAWLTFPDCLSENESIEDMAQTKIDLDKLPAEEMDRLSTEFREVVSMTRKINLNVGTVGGTDKEAANMADGIWGHIEKSIVDILSFQDPQASIGCWELHLAIEKALKVYLKQICGSWVFGHDLKKLSANINSHDVSLDFSVIQSLPSDKDAIKLRYAELVKNVSEAVDYYKKALRLIESVTNKYERKYSINNASLLLKMAPWAK